MSDRAPYSGVHIIFNPNSTGSSEDDSKELAETLRDAGIENVNLVPTEYAGHATDLAFDIAKKNERPLIVSASGDGGYHEVINGALRAQRDGAKPVCAVLATGNANDHDRAVLDRPLSEAIISGQTREIDVLEIRNASGLETETRYAHSYMGIGLTPVVAVELNKTSLNRINEVLIALKAFADFEPIEVQVKGKTVELQSLVIANVSQMSKVLKIATGAKVDDGLMWITAFPNEGKLKLIWRLIKTATVGVKAKRATNYAFRVPTKMVMQLDGEVVDLDANARVNVSVVTGLLTTVQ